MNRRILYNRASVNRKGEPFNPRKWVIRWNAENKTWEGDVPDGAMPPGETNPFIMLASGVGQLYSPDLVDGPFPEHYEPVESPVKNPFSKIQSSPCAQVWQSTEFDRYGTPDVFPIVATTYRVSEHWQTGAMSRNMPWLVGLVPNAFVEIGTALAKREGIKNGDRVIVSSARGSIEVYALVTERFQPFFIEGQMSMRSACRGTGAMRGSCLATSPMISPPASATPTRTFPRPKCFSAISRKRTASMSTAAHSESRKR